MWSRVWNDAVRRDVMNRFERCPSLPADHPDRPELFALLRDVAWDLGAHVLGREEFDWLCEGGPARLGPWLRDLHLTQLALAEADVRAATVSPETVTSRAE